MIPGQDVVYPWSFIINIIYYASGVVDGMHHILPIFRWHFAMRCYTSVLHDIVVASAYIPELFTETWLIQLSVAKTNLSRKYQLMVSTGWSVAGFSENTIFKWLIWKTTQYTSPWKENTLYFRNISPYTSLMVSSPLFMALFGRLHVFWVFCLCVLAVKVRFYYYSAFMAVLNLLQTIGSGIVLFTKPDQAGGFWYVPI